MAKNFIVLLLFFSSSTFAAINCDTSSYSYNSNIKNTCSSLNNIMDSTRKNYVNNYLSVQAQSFGILNSSIPNTQNAASNDTGQNFTPAAINNMQTSTPNNQQNKNQNSGNRNARMYP